VGDARQEGRAAAEARGNNPQLSIQAGFKARAAYEAASTRGQL
jgi:hypothetical protein